MKGLVIGRIVHYVTINHGERAAIIVNVINKEMGIVNLQVFGDTANTGEYLFGERNLRWMVNIAYSEEIIEDSWHWIERE